VSKKKQPKAAKTAAVIGAVMATTVLAAGATATVIQSTIVHVDNANSCS
jgi:hypothetical protein